MKTRFTSCEETYCRNWPSHNSCRVHIVCFAFTISGDIWAGARPVLMLFIWDYKIHWTDNIGFLVNRIHGLDLRSINRTWRHRHFFIWSDTNSLSSMSLDNDWDTECDRMKELQRIKDCGAGDLSRGRWWSSEQSTTMPDAGPTIDKDNVSAASLSSQFNASERYHKAG